MFFLLLLCVLCFTVLRCVTFFPLSFSLSPSVSFLDLFLLLLLVLFAFSVFIFLIIFLRFPLVNLIQIEKNNNKIEKEKCSQHNFNRRRITFHLPNLTTHSDTLTQCIYIINIIRLDFLPLYQFRRDSFSSSVFTCFGLAYFILFFAIRQVVFCFPLYSSLIFILISCYMMSCRMFPTYS